VVRDLYGHGIGKKVHEEPMFPITKARHGCYVKRGNGHLHRADGDGGTYEMKDQKTAMDLQPGRISFGHFDIQS